MNATVLNDVAAAEAERLEASRSEMRTLPEQLAAQTQKLFRDVIASKRVDELHASREKLLRLYDDHIAIAERNSSRAENVGSLLASDFAAIADEIRTQRDDLFSKWQTKDGLYRVLIDLMMPSHERRRELARKYPPPQSWYEETINPFEAE